MIMIDEFDFFSYQKYLLSQYKIVFQKKFGQNFLMDYDHVRKLVDTANIQKDDLVIEIGPGGGFVTFLLKELSDNVIAYEVDKQMSGILKIEFAESKTLQIVNKSFLDLTMVYEEVVHTLTTGVSNKVTHSFTKNKYKVVSSLPYNISKLIIMRLLEQPIRPTTMTYIIQKEVALDYCAKTPKATFLSNYISMYGKCEYIQKVPKELFNPVPKVDGAIIHITIDEDKAKLIDKKLVKFIKRIFGQPRKNIGNTLTNVLQLDKQLVLDALEELGIDSNLRPANLEPEDWRRIYQVLNQKRF